jgi:hypothetical protein
MTLASRSALAIATLLAAIGCGAAAPEGLALSLEEGALLVGLVEIEVSVADASAVRGVEFLVDGHRFHTALAPPFAASLDTPTLDDGVHQLEVSVVGTTGAPVTRDLSVAVDNLPAEVAIVAPLAGTVYRLSAGPLYLEAEVDDPSGPVAVDFFVAHLPVASFASAPYAVAVPAEALAGVAAGQRDLRVEARSAAGHRSLATLAFELEP